MNFKVDEDTYFDMECSVTIKIKKEDDIIVLNKDCSVCINEEDGWYFVMVYDVGGFTYQVFKTRNEKIAKQGRYMISDAIDAIKIREAIKTIQENDFINLTTKEIIEKIADKLPEGKDTFDICNDYEDRSACYGEEFYD